MFKMRIISWNVNGIRSMAGKLKDGRKEGSKDNNGIKSLIEEQNPDVLCLQEIKTQNNSDLEFLDFKYKLTNFAEKKGYSGVALLTNIRPIWVSYDMREQEQQEQQEQQFMNEGRIITARFKNVIIVNVYVPNSQD
jgi:exodeoxyribonuclease-3